MADRETEKPVHADAHASASSEDYPVSASHEYHPGGYSYVELVSDIQHRLGRLSEAVETLKTESAAHGKKLSDIGQDIHTAKVTLKIAGWIIGVLLALACWVGNKATDAYIHSKETSAAQPAKP